MSRTLHWWFPLYLALGAVLFSGQNPYGRIGGRVADSAGAVVPGASVKVIHVETGVETLASTNEEGYYEAANLNPGPYRVVAEMKGFKRYERVGVEVRVGDVLDIPITLELGQVSETVTVTAEAPLLESTNADVGQVVDSRQVEDLPLPGGSVAYLMQLTPGVISTNPPTHGWLPQAVDAQSAMAVSGTRTRASEFSLDGIPNMTKDGQLSFSPPPGMVQEFRVQTAPFDASVGHFSGAHVNMALKSGTNALRGSAYWQHLVPGWAARDFFTNRFIYDTSTGPVTKEKIETAWPPVKTDRYWVTAGGPVLVPRVYSGRNRTFWMYGFDLLDRNRPERGNPYTVPTSEQRKGDFSQLLALGAQYQIYDPFSTRPDQTPGRFRRQPLAGNIIPASRIDPMAAKIVSYYPLPNASGAVDGRNNYSDPKPRRIDYHAQMLRLDHVLSQTNRMSASLTWTYLDTTWNNPFHNAASGQWRNRLHRGFSLGDIWTPRPNVVADVRYGVTRFTQYDRPMGIGFDLAKFGFAPSLTRLLDGRYTSFPETEVAGYATLGDVSGVKATTTYHTLNASVSNPRGSHVLRYGGELRVLQENSYNWGNVSPHLTFSTNWTRGPLDNSAASPIGQGLASLLFGLPTGGYIDRNSPFSEQSRYLGLYVQDNWRATRRLTLNLGLRYEYEFPTTERFNRFTRGFDFQSINPVNDAARANYARSPSPLVPVDRFQLRGGLLFAAVGGNPRGLWNPDRNNFSPRAGLAFAVRPRLVLRAGYGIFFENLGSDRTDIPQQGFDQRTSLVASLDNGQTYRASIANPFPDGILEPAGASGGLATYAGRAPVFFWPERRAGYMQRWSFNIQREFPHRVLLSIGYVGNRGTRLGGEQEFNAVPAEYLSRSPVRDTATINRLTAAVTNPFLGIPQFEGSGLQGRTVQTQQLLRPMPHFTSVSTTLDDAFSWYHSLQIRVERRFAKGFSVQGSYTWSKFMEARDKLNGSDLARHHVVSPQDRPQRVVINGIYELPFGRGRRWLNRSGWVHLLVGGWQSQGIYQGQSGPPLGFGNILFYGNIHDIVLPRSQRTVERWFNTGAGFERDSRLQLAQNIRTFPLRLTGARADGYNNWDLSLFKTWRIRERFSVQLRAEAQDALNHAMFSPPNTVPTNSAFGQVNSSVAPEQRRINISTRVSW